MSETPVKAKKQKVIGIVRDINISKDDLLDYLKTIGVEATINTTLESDIVEKFSGILRKMLKKKIKDYQSPLSLLKKYDVVISDAQEKIQQEEDKLKQAEEEKRMKKLIEEENQKKELEKRLQEESL
ncbi:MAG: hypothetical protein R2942_01905 [Ignavibacteria bacterium]